MGDNGPVRSELWRDDPPAPAMGATTNSRTTLQFSFREDHARSERKGYIEGMEGPVNSSIYNPEDSRRVTANYFHVPTGAGGSLPSVIRALDGCSDASPLE